MVGLESAVAAIDMVIRYYKSYMAFIFQLFIAFFIYITPAIAHEGTIRGMVRDPKTHLPLSGASVMLEGAMKKGTYTDQFGMYKFSSLHSGKYTITISHIGYEKIVLERVLKVEETITVETVLKYADLQLSEVTVNSKVATHDFNAVHAQMTMIGSIATYCMIKY